jgi:hypothetical protein
MCLKGEKNMIIKRISAFVIIFVIIVSMSMVLAVEKPEQKTINILFIGNSLTFVNEMPSIFQFIAHNKGKSVYVDYTSLCIPGASLSMLHQQKNYKSTIFDNKWDYVVLQELGGFSSSNNLNSVESTYNVIRSINADIKKIKARTVLYIPPLAGMNSYKDNYLAYQSSSDQVHINIASEIGAAVSPAGYVVAIISQKYNFEPLSDNLHSTYISSYLTACTMYATIFNESPYEGLQHRLVGNTTVNENWQQFQNLAWQSVNKFYDENKNIACLKLSNNVSGAGNATINLVLKNLRACLSQITIFILIYSLLILVGIFLFINFYKIRNKTSKNDVAFRIKYNTYFLGIIGIIISFSAYISYGVLSNIIGSIFFNAMTFFQQLYIYISTLIPFLLVESYFLIFTYSKYATFKGRIYFILISIISILNLLLDGLFITYGAFGAYFVYYLIPVKSSSSDYNYNNILHMYTIYIWISFFILIAFILKLIAFIKVINSRRKLKTSLLNT